MSPVTYDEAAFDPLDDLSLRRALGKAIREATVPIFQRHFDQGQSSWEENDPEYARAKGNKPKFVNTGDARQAISSTHHRYKKVRVSRRGDVYKASVALSRMKDGLNVYGLAQRGKTKSPSDNMEISSVQDGDENEALKAVEEALVAMLEEKGLIE